MDKTNIKCAATIKWAFFTFNIQKSIFNSAARSYYLRTRHSDKQTEINISEFLTFVWLLSSKCQVCLSFVIKIKKMTKLRQKLQISLSDVIRALSYWTIEIQTNLAWISVCQMAFTYLTLRREGGGWGGFGSISPVRMERERPKSRTGTQSYANITHLLRSILLLARTRKKPKRAIFITPTTW